MIKRKIYILVILGLSILILNMLFAHGVVLANNNTEELNNKYSSLIFNAKEISSSARAMYLFESNSGREIFKKDCEKELPMASTTKIVTAITALENFKGNLDEKHIVPSDAVGLEGTSMYLKYGEEVTFRELLYGLMLPSGNDAGKALALLTSETEADFCSLMSKTAKKAGANNSSFANSHGLDAEGHYTTAKDLAKITAYALKNDIFREIVSTKNAVIEKTNKYQTRYYKNKNKLLFNIPDCIGVKTGFTDNAGRCLVTATDDGNRQYVCVVLNCPDMFEESERLISLAKNEYTFYNVIDKQTVVDCINVKNGKINSVNLYPLQALNLLLSKEEYNNLHIEYDYNKEVSAPITPQDNLGSIKVFIGEDLIFSTKLCTIEYVKSLATKDLIKDIIDNWS